jgi:5-methylcytosine-specific restriction endonuclease McrA
VSRVEFTNATKRDAFMRAEGRCEGKLLCGERCNVRLRSGGVHYDHITPTWLSGDNSLENCQCLCPPCHREKTGKRDAPMIAKTKRQRDRDQGIKQRSDRPIPGSRGSGVRKPFNKPPYRDPNW